MKIKSFLFLPILIYLTGCEITATNRPIERGVLSEHEIITVVKESLITRYNPKYYIWDTNDQYHYYYNQIPLNNYYVGDVTILSDEPLYGYVGDYPYQGNVKIYNDDVKIYVNVLDHDYLDITYYDYYNSRFDVHFRTTWEELGF